MVVRKVVRGIGRFIGTIFSAVKLVNLGRGPDIIADRKAMFGDDPENDPRRMDYDPDRPVHRRR